MSDKWSFPSLLKYIRQLHQYILCFKKKLLFFQQELVYHCHLSFFINSLFLRKVPKTLRWGFVTYFFPLSDRWVERLCVCVCGSSVTYRPCYMCGCDVGAGGRIPSRQRVAFLGPVCISTSRHVVWLIDEILNLPFKAKNWNRSLFGYMNWSQEPGLLCKWNKCVKN